MTSEKAYINWAFLVWLGSISFMDWKAVTQCFICSSSWPIIFSVNNLLVSIGNHSINHPGLHRMLLSAVSWRLYGIAEMSSGWSETAVDADWIVWFALTFFFCLLSPCHGKWSCARFVGWTLVWKVVADEWARSAAVCIDARWPASSVKS